MAFFVLFLLQVKGPLGVLTGGSIELSNGTNCFETAQLDNFMLQVPAGKDCGSPITQVSRHCHSVAVKPI